MTPLRPALLCLLLGFCGFARQASAQDPVYSQFFAAPLQLNPAFAGNTYAPHISTNFRTQWSGFGNAYVTYGAAYSQYFDRLNSGFGLMVMADDAGNGILKTNYFHLYYSYRVQLRKNAFIKFGVEGGLIQSRLDWQRLIFFDQLDPMNGPIGVGGDFNPTEEQQPEDLTRVSPDLSAGFLLYSDKFYGGLSLKHLNRPDDNFLNINPALNEGLPIRWSLHGGAQFRLGKSNKYDPPAFISPNLMLTGQGDFYQLNAGAYAGAGVLFGGAWFRHTFGNPDAVILLFGLQQGALKVGYSYDITVSRLNGLADGTGGAHEFSLTINLDNTPLAQARRRNAVYNDCFQIFR